MFITLLVNSLVFGSIYGLMALSFSLIYKASGLMSFVQGEILMIGGFIGLTFYGALNLPFFIALPIVFIVMFFIGILIERFFIRNMTERKSELIYISILTMGLASVLKSLAKIVWGTRNFQFRSIFGISIVKLGNVRLEPEALFGCLFAIFLMVVLTLFMNKTKLGTSMRAAAQDPMAASVIGINSGMTTYVTWGIACCIASMAGIILGPISGVNFNMGNMISLKGFAAAVLGGYGNMYGAIVGGVVIGIIETFTSGYISSSYKDVVSFFALIAVLAFRPSGIFNEKAI